MYLENVDVELQKESILFPWGLMGMQPNLYCIGQCSWLSFIEEFKVQHLNNGT